MTSIDSRKVYEPLLQGDAMTNLLDCCEPGSSRQCFCQDLHGTQSVFVDHHPRQMQCRFLTNDIQGRYRETAAS